MTNLFAPTKLTLHKVLFCLIFFGISGTASAAKLYKWIDEDGEIRYSDHVPPSQVKQELQTLNAQGIVVETKEAAKTEEEIEAYRKVQKELQAKHEIQKQNKEVQARLDKVLLLTFSSEAEMSSVKDNRIDVLDSVIRLIYKSIATTQDKLIRLQNVAKQQYTSKGLEIPGGLAQNIEESTRKIDNRDKQLALKLGEKYKIEAQYEIDISRFRLLRNTQN